ncbi:hypothetical protein AVEN_195258-1 [Araneus ventricosus]|uniref:Uncharacterized protein n=1 Tax=Araneus ventricosus TaxID=182803 RepID=A0A4Y2ULY5_ARAVE|nr:hypothetical protein AVEN_195258-1 [Araneus ventricosus]
MAATSARAKYMQYLESERSKEKTETKQLKRKALEEEIEDPPPPYTPGFYNPATGRPYNEANDNCLNSQPPVIQRQRAVATVTISPSCPPYPSTSPPHYNISSSIAPGTRQPNELRRSGSGNNYEDELSGAMGATHI